MNPHIRKFVVMALSLGVMILLYLVYLRFSNTPPIPLQQQVQVADVNDEPAATEAAKIGNVGVERVEKARYPELDKNGRRVGEFGFEKLIHEMGNEWEIEKPYRNIYRPDFKCYITADKGTVKVEDAFGKPHPQDATLTGNVLVSIIPQAGSDIKESRIYLDDIHFIGDKSLYTTSGPVKFISKDASMLGRGLEIVYNEAKEHLEYLKVVKLQSLRIKTSSGSSIFSSKDKAKGQSKQSVTVSDSKLKNQKPVKDDKEKYRCVFNRNVVIDCPEQVIFADRLSIDDILLSGSKQKSPESDDQPKDINQPDIYQPQEINKPDDSDANLIDIVITCDEGFIVSLENSIIAEKKIFAPYKAPENIEKLVNDFNDSAGRVTFAAEEINYFLETENGIAQGPLKLKFYPNDTMGDKTKSSPVPATVTAKDKARYISASSQVIFEGSCLGETTRQEPNFTREYTLKAPKLTIDLFTDNNDNPQLKHLTADGGVVQLANAKIKNDETLGFVKLKCHRFDYDPAERAFLAFGPGIIAVDNAGVSMPSGSQEAGFNLRRPCYALIENFKTLRYYQNTDTVVTDAESHQINIGYIPVFEDQRQQVIKMTAGHVVTKLSSDGDGRQKLLAVHATKGITYNEQTQRDQKSKPKEIHFVGSEFFYDAQENLVTIQGNETTPCFLNGMRVKDGVIKYDLKSEKIKAKVVGPGIWQR
ncbi:MAG: LptA/OstA family protein [Planctomycetota bacterium]|jgi:hypothetical protein